MNTRLALSFSALALLATPVSAQTFLANNGLLYDAGPVRLAIDGLFGTAYDEYPPLPEPLRSAFEAAQEPFSDIAFILATHRHEDHMTAGAMARYLCASPETIAFVPRDARDAVQDAASCVLDEDRLRTGFEPVERDGILVTPVAVPHVGTRWPDLDNRAYVIQGAGGRIVHLGDSDLPENLVAEPIDVLVTPYWNIQEETFMPRWERAGKPFLILIHIPPAERARIRDAAAEMGLDAWVPQEPMETLTGG